MVNIFIPLSDPKEIAKVLDDKRLGKQRVEAKQIITILSGEAKSKAWSNHPAVRMWTGYLDELKYYYDCMVIEWMKRGYVNNMPIFDTTKSSKKMPWFMYCKPVLLSYQANLLRKNYDHYHKYFKSKILKSYIHRSYLWTIVDERYLTETQMNYLKSLVDKTVIPASFNINEYTKLHADLS